MKQSDIKSVTYITLFLTYLYFKLVNMTKLCQ